MSLADLFVVGLAFDIAGALALIYGLVPSTATIASLGTYAGISYGMTVERCQARADAEIGLVGIVLGFILQAVGYGATLLGAGTSTGPRELLYAALLFCVALATMAFLWRRQREPRLKHLLVQVPAQMHSDEGGKPASAGEWTNSRTMYLVGLAKSAGWNPIPADGFEVTVDGFIARVFDIKVPRFLPMPEVRD
jgi:hypothetical protein